MSVTIQKKSVVHTGSESIATASNIRWQALSLPGLRHRSAAIELGLSDPDPFIRLKVASNLASLFEEQFYHGSIGDVLKSVDKIIFNPRLFYKERDPRLAEDLEFDRKRAANNIRLGVVMAIQAIARNSDSFLRIPLANFFTDKGLFDTIEAAREDKSFLMRCIDKRAALPEFNSDTDSATEYIMTLFKYSIAISILENEELRIKHFPQLSLDSQELANYRAVRLGLINSIVPLSIAAIEGAEVRNKPAETDRKRMLVISTFGKMNVLSPRMISELTPGR